MRKNRACINQKKLFNTFGTIRQNFVLNNVKTKMYIYKLETRNTIVLCKIHVFPLLHSMRMIHFCDISSQSYFDCPFQR